MTINEIVCYLQLKKTCEKESISSQMRLIEMQNFSVGANHGRESVYPFDIAPIEFNSNGLNKLQRPRQRGATPALDRPHIFKAKGKFTDSTKFCLALKKTCSRQSTRVNFQKFPPVGANHGGA